MNKIAEYYKIYLKEFCQYVKSVINWASGIVALFSLIFGGAYYLVFQGWGAMLEETINFVAFTLAPLGFISLLFLLYGLLVRTPVNIFQKQKDKIDNIRKKYELELEKYDWSNVDFYVTFKGF